ncbi:MAG: carbamoyltransferase HypF [Bacteroidetes bacterium]|nr:MAG: carbamoyltransferase HypF [Bacteroidota bacterium]
MNTRCKISIRGAVQGVGFRPFIFRLATELELNGWVLNSSQGVFIEVEGEKCTIDSLLVRLHAEKPPLAFIQSLEVSFLSPVGYSKFEIRHSESNGEYSAFILPDIATCPDCVKEIFDPANRRFLYPFTNCTNCGPRYSIIEALPYDRHHTTMSKFEMCDDCWLEYNNPLDRRFHAQPNACPTCGPHLELWDTNGEILAHHSSALPIAVDAIRTGMILALKGLGGFQLIVDARNEDAVNRLRTRKHREEKPFALMFPSLESIKEQCEVTALEERLLCSPESPIVLLKHLTHISNPVSHISSQVASRNPYLGAMLPYTPLHHILMRELEFPVVATSGNISDEPICIDEHEALVRLNRIADVFLVHNRPIKRHVDDSVTRILLGRELIVRRSRGYAPLPITIENHPESPMLAVGAHLKNTVALAASNNVFISQHIGDLETEKSYNAFQAVIADFKKLYNAQPQEIICDLHPGYLSSTFAHNMSIPVTEVQHHYAHIASCMAENQLEGTVLGVAWDGTGYGPDGTIWGGEFLLTNETSFERVATFRPFRLPGGEKAIREPRRVALGMLYEMYGEGAFEKTHLAPLQAFTSEERSLIRTMLANNINSPVTSSAGRIFDAVASLLNIRQHSSFEGQAAMELEFLANGVQTEEHYLARSITEKTIFQLSPKQAVANSPQHARIIINWIPILEAILQDIQEKVELPVMAAKFHNSLAEIIVAVAKQVKVKRLVLSGGCFQNSYLTAATVRKLESAGFSPFLHQRVPPNDGGIALGQIYARIRHHSGIKKIHHQLQSQEITS